MNVRTPRIAAPIAALGALAVLPASALAAPVLTKPLAGCYVSVDPSARQIVNVHAAGFTPLTAVSTMVDGRPGSGPTYDSKKDGTVFAKVQAPYIAAGERAFSVTLTDTANAANTLTVASRVTALKVTLTPRRAATSSRVHFTGRGFTKPRAIWGHYVFHGQVRKTVRLAAGPATACGTFSARRRQIPIAHPRPGKWTLQVDQQKRYSTNPNSVFYPVPITVRRVIGG